VAAKPGPVAAKPAPVAAKPAPVAAKPAPVAPKPPPPVEEGPDPAEEFFPDEINEAGFFVEQGLYDEAREILQVILEDLPDSPKANRLMRKLDALERGESPPDENAAPAAPEEDGSVSLAQELEEEFSGILPAEQQDEPVQISVDEVLAEFKKGVDKQLSQDDVDARHDLGIAYKEMGLFDDAVAEFERSSRGPRKEADAWYLVGLCRLEQQQEREAVAAFQRALEAKVITDHQRNAIHFEMGSAHQALGELPEALLLFRQVAEADPMFKDVGQRLVELEGQGVVPAQGKRKAGPGPGNGTAPAAGAAGAGAKKGKNIGYI
jgi:TolA-binding protein